MTPVKGPPLTLLQFFIPTPLSLDFSLGSQDVRLETNSEEILQKTALTFDPRRHPFIGRPQFLWRLVSEDEVVEADRGEPVPAESKAVLAAWPGPTGFGQDGLAFVNFGQRGFLAVDTSAKRAVGFIPEAWVREGERFTAVFLRLLQRLTTAPLSDIADSEYLA